MLGFDRITFDPNILGGKACIRGMRISVSLIVNLVANGMTTAEIVAEQYSEWPYAPSMTYFSSRGPNPVAPDIIKPDITAHGIQILAGNSPTPIGGYPGELFQDIAGTSMSSPHIAGIAALIMQAHPDWSPMMVKSALMTTAYQEVTDAGGWADAFDFGAGHVAELLAVVILEHEVDVGRERPVGTGAAAHYANGV